MDFLKKFDHREPDIFFSQEKIFAVIRDIEILPRITGIEKLTDGFSHVNYRLSADDGRDFVLRISGKSKREFESEISILGKVADLIPVPKVLYAQVENIDIGRHIAIQEFVPGRLLSHVEEELRPREIEQIAKHLGVILAKIHSIKFESAGFLGGNFSVVEPFQSFKEGYFGYMNLCLASELVAKNLAPDLLVRLKKYVVQNSSISDELAQTSNLTHSDFNQKNILVDRHEGVWRVTSILDWEFSFSGCPLIDFGNFFRFEDEMSSHYRTPLEVAYRGAGGTLVDDWRKQARYLDILSMLQFLNRESKYPNTFRTANSVIERTIRD